MRFETIIPCQRLRPYIRQFVISENAEEQSYKVFPGSSMVLGFQYRGDISVMQGNEKTQLSSAGITGILDGVRTFQSNTGTGTILVYFTETGLAHFSICPANELFNLSIPLEHVFDKQKVQHTEEKLGAAMNDHQRIAVMEKFFLSQLRDLRQDQLVLEAVKLIYAQKGVIRITDLSKKLLISQSPLEKRFRKLVGTTPKKFASIIRFHAVLNDIYEKKSLTDICYENNFFDQAHFIKDFRQYTGTTPEFFQKGL